MIIITTKSNYLFKKFDFQSLFVFAICKLLIIVHYVNTNNVVEFFFSGKKNLEKVIIAFTCISLVSLTKTSQQ